MEGFTLIDGIVAGVILISAILAYSRGVVREIMAIVGWLGAAVVAYLFAGQAVPLVKEIPGVTKVVGDNCELAIIASFLVVFAACLVLASLFTPLFSSVVQRSVLGGIDQALGFVFGAGRGILLVVAAFVVYGMANQSIAMVDNSRATKIFEGLTGDVRELLPTDLMAVIENHYSQMTSSCTPPAGETGITTGTTIGG